MFVNFRWSRRHQDAPQRDPVSELNCESATSAIVSSNQNTGLRYERFPAHCLERTRQVPHNAVELQVFSGKTRSRREIQHKNGVHHCGHCLRVRSHRADLLADRKGTVSVDNTDNIKRCLVSTETDAKTSRANDEAGGIGHEL